ncbi:MAG TPA: hypothetical protein VKM55_00820 [Candidatus Lokiarchaeia archaeon]|nr:hypothetical protein [Candidatus Lokiarchaeia archaeon]
MGRAVIQLKSMSPQLRSTLTILKINWKEINGCYPWIQAEFKLELLVDFLEMFIIEDLKIIV